MTKAQIDAALRRAAEREAARQTMTFQIGSFNVLGSQHSAPGGDHARYPAAGARNVGAVARIRSFGVDILGTQELQADQLNALTSMTGLRRLPRLRLRLPRDRQLDPLRRLEVRVRLRQLLHDPLHARQPAADDPPAARPRHRPRVLRAQHARLRRRGRVRRDPPRRSLHRGHHHQPSQGRGHPDLPDRRHERPGRVLLPRGPDHRHGRRDRRQHLRRLPPGAAPWRSTGCSAGATSASAATSRTAAPSAGSATTTSWSAPPPSARCRERWSRQAR